MCNPGASAEPGASLLSPSSSTASRAICLLRRAERSINDPAPPTSAQIAPAQPGNSCWPSELLSWLPPSGGSECAGLENTSKLSVNTTESLPIPRPVSSDLENERHPRTPPDTLRALVPRDGRAAARVDHRSAAGRQSADVQGAEPQAAAAGHRRRGHGGGIVRAGRRAPRSGRRTGLSLLVRGREHRARRARSRSNHRSLCRGRGLSTAGARQPIAAPSSLGDWVLRRPVGRSRSKRRDRLSGGRDVRQARRQQSAGDLRAADGVGQLHRQRRIRARGRHVPRCTRPGRSELRGRELLRLDGHPARSGLSGPAWRERCGDAAAGRQHLRSRVGLRDLPLLRGGPRAGIPGGQPFPDRRPRPDGVRQRLPRQRHPHLPRRRAGLHEGRAVPSHCLRRFLSRGS